MQYTAQDNAKLTQKINFAKQCHTSLKHFSLIRDTLDTADITRLIAMHQYLFMNQGRRQVL